MDKDRAMFAEIAYRANLVTTAHVDMCLAEPVAAEYAFADDTLADITMAKCVSLCSRFFDLPAGAVHFTQTRTAQKMAINMRLI